MPSNRKAQGYTALRIEGRILPPEFLQEIAAQQAPNQSNADYGVSRSLSIKDELARYWRIANDLWAMYVGRHRRIDQDPERIGIATWLLPLLREVLGYPDLQATGPVAVGDRLFPVTHLACGASVPLLLTIREFGLDRADARFGDGGRRRTPHALMQEYLNAQSGRLWGLVANGSRLRLLRHNPSLTRPAYLEADLELIFEEQLYANFAALWLTLHASRLRPEDGRPSTCILESWRLTAHETGERALQHLRDGVTEAMRRLGNGFLQHPSNEALREAIAQGRLTPKDLFQELLRLVYRLLLLFTAEERDLLHPPQTTGEQRGIYREGYSVARLRERAGRRRHFDQHADLWLGLQVVFRGLAGGAESLGLTALGGLFAPEQCPTLDAAALSNERLLEAVRALAFFQAGGAQARINYRDMDTEELGSVYESLLELHPRVDVDARPWTFGFVSDVANDAGRGSDRKLTGSYYTPASLVHELIKSALEPVMAEAIAKHPDNPRAALLDLKVLDPACGSGHFLLAAARRMAAEVARLEANADTPDESLRQHALREVVQHCIHGVDRNPLSVELCRAALWMETLEPGKPLTFLEARIQCGDSLVGILDPKVIEQGIPDEAYAPLTGDDKTVCRELKRRNKPSSTSVQNDLFDQRSLQEVAAAANTLDMMPEETLFDIEAKRRAWEEAKDHGTRRWAELLVNLYVAAFFAPKSKANAANVPITEDLHRVRLGARPRPGMEEAVTELASKHRFFHWHLSFPEVMARGGFDVILGNPPWERIKLQEQEFFAGRSPEIAKAPDKAARESLIKALSRAEAVLAEKALLIEFESAKHEAEAASQYIRTGRRYPLTGVGDVNMYAVFAETFLTLVSDRGRVGLIVPTGIATDSSTKTFFEKIALNGRLVSLFDFENSRGLFPGVHRSYKFCLLTLGRNAGPATYVFFATGTEQLSDDERRCNLSPEDIRLINPNTFTCPVLRSRFDAELTNSIYRRVPVLVSARDKATGNTWGVKLRTMFHKTNDMQNGVLVPMDYDIPPDIGGGPSLPVYEGNHGHQFHHRYATFEDGDFREVTKDELTLPTLRLGFGLKVRERDFRRKLDSWGVDRRSAFLGFRRVARNTDERTVIACLLPCLPTTYGWILCLNPPAADAAILCAAFNSLVFDYLLRNALSQPSIPQGVFEQVPVPPRSRIGGAERGFVVQRVLELSYTSWDMQPFAHELGFVGPPFPWDPNHRAFLRAELDAYFAHLYGLTRDELRFILDPADVQGSNYPSETFRVLKNNDVRQFGEYRTQRLVLQAWDRLVAEGWIALPASLSQGRSAM